MGVCNELSYQSLSRQAYCWRFFFSTNIKANFKRNKEFQKSESGGNREYRVIFCLGVYHIPGVCSWRREKVSLTQRATSRKCLARSLKPILHTQLTPNQAALRRPLSALTTGTLCELTVTGNCHSVCLPTLLTPRGFDHDFQWEPCIKAGQFCLFLRLQSYYGYNRFYWITPRNSLYCQESKRKPEQRIKYMI